MPNFDVPSAAGQGARHAASDDSLARLSSSSHSEWEQHLHGAAHAGAEAIPLRTLRQSTDQSANEPSAGPEASSERSHILRTPHDQGADEALELGQPPSRQAPSPQVLAATKSSATHAASPEEASRSPSPSSLNSEPPLKEEEVPKTREDRLDYYRSIEEDHDVYRSHRYYRGTTDVNLTKARENGFRPQDTRPEMVENLNKLAEEGEEWALRGRETYNKHVYLTKQLHPGDSRELGARDYAIGAAKAATERGEQAKPVVARLYVPDGRRVEEDPDAPSGKALRLPEYEMLEGKFALPDHADGPVVSASSESFRATLMQHSQNQLREIAEEHPDANFIPAQIPLSSEEAAELFHGRQTPPVNDLEREDFRG